MIVERFRRHRDHSNERPLDPPPPNIVRLIPPEPEPEPVVPVISHSPIRDHETLALEAATAMTPLAAYWAALTWGPAYAASWSAWVKARHQREWLRFLEEEDR